LRVLVKIGGTLLDDPQSRFRLAAEIGAAFGAGLDIAVVHGGGKQMTRFLEERGVQSRFVNGLRVTTDEVLDAVLKVLAGTVNKHLVAAFLQTGQAAVGISGIDANLVSAEPMDSALGHVGRPVRADARILEALIGARFLPVVACVAGDAAGRLYNVNADQMATACACAFRADHVLFLTDVEGVRGAAGGVEPELDGAECEELIASGIATGGMQAKLGAASAALAGGVEQVTIAPGARDNVLAAMLRGEAVGTRIVRTRTVAAS